GSPRTAGPQPRDVLQLALPFQPRLDRQAGAAADPAVDTRDAVEQSQRDPHTPGRRHPVAPRQHVQDGLVDTEGIARMHEKNKDRRLVVLVDKLEERTEPAAHATHKTGKLPRREIARAKGLENRPRRELTGSQGDVDAAREDGIDERDRVADGDEAIAD